MPGKTGKKAQLSFILVIPLVFISDRISKLFIIQELAEGESHPLIPGFLHLTRVNNTGAAFGILRNSGGFLVFVSAATTVFLSLYLWFHVFRARRLDPRVYPTDYASSLIIAGALGNLTDRLRYGYVVDFLDIRVWPVFNFADASISVGVFLILLHFLKSRVRRG